MRGIDILPASSLRPAWSAVRRGQRWRRRRRHAPRLCLRIRTMQIRDCANRRVARHALQRVCGPRPPYRRPRRRKTLQPSNGTIVGFREPKLVAKPVDRPRRHRPPRPPTEVDPANPRVVLGLPILCSCRKCGYSQSIFQVPPDGGSSGIHDHSRFSTYVGKTR